MTSTIDRIPADFPVQPIAPDALGAIDPTTCGTCGLTWDDGVSTSWTPTPAGRCPFEYFHEDAAENMGITLKIIEGPEYRRDDEDWEHNAYTLRLHYDGRTMDVAWRQGLGITDDPDVPGVMWALVSDAEPVEDGYMDFEEWAENYGYDPDSRKAEKIYNDVQEQTNKLRVLLGESYDEALERDWEA